MFNLDKQENVTFNELHFSIPLAVQKQQFNYDYYYLMLTSHFIIFPTR